jgi:hypothetical protein
MTKEELQRLETRTIKTEVVLPALHEIVERLNKAVALASTDEEKSKAKRKRAYWDALLTLVYAGYLE